MKKILIVLVLFSTVLGGTAAFAAQACCPHSACCASMQDCCQ